MFESPFMIKALEQAEIAFNQQEVPVGAVLVDSRSNKILASAGNTVETTQDPTAHAEMLVIQEACKLLHTPRLPFCDLYVTLEPCVMCAQAISHARIRRLYFGAYDKKMGGVDHGARVFAASSCHHQPEVIGGIHAQESSTLLKAFFHDKRSNFKSQ